MVKWAKGNGGIGRRVSSGERWMNESSRKLETGTKSGGWEGKVSKSNDTVFT